jgi:hypothetical protein
MKAERRLKEVPRMTEEKKPEKKPGENPLDQFTPARLKIAAIAVAAVLAIALLLWTMGWIGGEAEKTEPVPAPVASASPVIS